MKPGLASIPWSYSEQWQEANFSLKQIIARAGRGLDGSRDLAVQLSAAYRSIFPDLDRLCRVTCPRCRDNCCRRAWVWFDFKDLLFLNLARLPIPPGQLLTQRGERCRYITTSGCCLDRLQRPFVCTWYLCPTQTRRLDRQSADGKVMIQHRLADIKHLRRKMESVFIQHTT
ncbi:MAG: hypothetical protein WBG37_04335 [Desulfobacterales bacterium]